MQKESEPRWLSVPEVARRHGTSDKNIYQAIENGTLKARIAHKTERLRYWEIREDWYQEWAAAIQERRTPRPAIEQIGRRGASTVAA